MGTRGPKTQPIRLQLVRGNPRQLSKAEIAARLKAEPKPKRTLTVEAIDALPASERQRQIMRRIVEVLPYGVLAEVDIALVHAHAAARETFEWADARIRADTLVVKDLAHGGFKTNPFMRVRSAARGRGC
jgi:phage terminase small subunit